MPSTTAVVRGVPGSFARALSSSPRPAIDPRVAAAQHEDYCRALGALGLRVVRVAADEGHPDSPFVDDTAVVLGDRAVIARPGAPERAGETGPVRSTLEGLGLHPCLLPEGVRLDGGDVLRIGGTLHVGLSGRTDPAAVAALRELAAPLGLAVVGTPVQGALHLKSVASWLGDGILVELPGHAALPRRRLDVVEVPAQEAQAANCLRAGDTVLLPAGCPRTRAALARRGLDVAEVEVGEFHKADGGVGCLALLF